MESPAEDFIEEDLKQGALSIPPHVDGSSFFLFAQSISMEDRVLILNGSGLVDGTKILAKIVSPSYPMIKLYLVSRSFTVLILRSTS